MATITEGLVVSDVVKKELPDYLSRENETVKASQTLLLGAVVQKNSSDQLLALAAEADEVQTIAITGTLISGTFTLTFKNAAGAYVTTDPIAWNADDTAIQTGVDTAIAGSLVVVTAGGTPASFVLTFSGAAYTGLAQEPVVVDSSALGTATVVSDVDAVQTVAITGTLASGEFTIAFIDSAGARVETDPIAWNADTAAIQAGVDTALGGSKVTVGGTGTVASHTLTFGGTGYTNLPQTLAEYDVSNLEATEDVTVTPTTAGTAARTATSVEDVTVTETTAGGAGGNDAYGVILEAVTTGAGETQAVACITNNAELNSANLSYGSGDSTLANAALNAKNIKTTAAVT